jgi:hypothetical protein
MDGDGCRHELVEMASDTFLADAIGVSPEA